MATMNNEKTQAQDEEFTMKKRKHEKKSEKHMKAMCKHCKGGHKTSEHKKHEKKSEKHEKKEAKHMKHKKTSAKGHAPKGAHGRAAVRALGRTKTTGNFAKIEKAKGKGAAIMAYQHALRAHKGVASKMAKKMSGKEMLGKAMKHLKH